MNEMNFLLTHTRVLFIHYATPLGFSALYTHDIMSSDFKYSSELGDEYSPPLSVREIVSLIPLQFLPEAFHCSNYLKTTTFLLRTETERNHREIEKYSAPLRDSAFYISTKTTTY